MANGVTKVKLYCCYTPSHEKLYKEYFLPSVDGSFEVVSLKQGINGDGVYSSKGYEKSLNQRLDFIIKSIQVNMGNVIVWSDVDIIFMGLTANEIIKDFEEGGHDIAFSRLEIKSPTICFGFFVVRCNEETLKFFRNIYIRLYEFPDDYDQTAAQHLLNDGAIQFSFLPEKYYGMCFGRMPTQKPRMFHATCCVGIEAKIVMLNKIKEKFKKEFNIIKITSSNSDEDSVILDIGANDGGYTNIFLGCKGNIHAFEPCPKLADGMRERYKDNPRVKVFQSGVSDKSYSETGMTVFNAWTIGKKGEIPRGLSEGALDVVGRDLFDVNFVTVDEHVESENIQKIKFIKIDVDGYEYRVLKGAENTIKKFRPWILIEISYMVKDVGDSVPDYLDFIYDELGYELFDNWGNNISKGELLNDYPWHTSYDMVMLPKGEGEEIFKK